MSSSEEVDPGFEGVICSGFDMHCALYGTLPPGVAFALRMTFDELSDVGFEWCPSRVQVAMGSGHPMGSGGIWAWGRTLYIPWGLLDMCEETDLTRPEVFGALCHEVYHCWQFARDGILPMVRRMLRPRYWSEGRWSDQEFEHEATSFECMAREYWSDPVNVPLLRTLVRGVEHERDQQAMDRLVFSTQAVITHGVTPR